jgi:hypothetical protein
MLKITIFNFFRLIIALLLVIKKVVSTFLIDNLSKLLTIILIDFNKIIFDQYN